jgi:membrane protease YdiL (CAAX protease family)/Flp pilus assembly protein TadD
VELIQRGRAEFASNHWDTAESLFRTATESDLTNSTAFSGLGASLYKLKRYREAVGAYERAVTLDAKSTNAWLGLGSGSYSMGDYEKAADAYQKFVLLEPTNSEAQYWFARSQVKLKDYDEGIKLFNRALTLNPKDSNAFLWLGICHYHKKAFQAAVDALQECVSLDSTTFYGHSWLGFSFYELRRYGAATTSLQNALQLRPNDFEANYWRGLSLLHAGRFEEATANFEKTYELKKGNKAMRRWLFYCYLLSSQYKKAYRLFPSFFTVAGSVLMLGYFAGLTVLLHFTFKVRPDPSPGFGFSLSWVALFFEGQIAFIFFLGLLSSIKVTENPLTGIILAGTPLLIAAAKGFTRQPWGRPFAWPRRLGSRRIIGFSLFGLILASLFNYGYSELVRWISRKPFPGQEAIPFIKYALNANPVTAFLSVVIVGPLVEEILFRGLIYGAWERRLKAGGAIVVSSLMFALVHFQLVYFIPIFCLGTVLGWARWKTGSLGLPMMIHVFNNGCFLVILRLSGKGA